MTTERIRLSVTASISKVKDMLASKVCLLRALCQATNEAPTADGIWTLCVLSAIPATRYLSEICPGQARDQLDVHGN